MEIAWDPWRRGAGVPLSELSWRGCCGMAAGLVGGIIEELRQGRCGRGCTEFSVLIAIYPWLIPWRDDEYKRRPRAETGANYDCDLSLHCNFYIRGKTGNQMMYLQSAFTNSKPIVKMTIQEHVQFMRAWHQIFTNWDIEDESTLLEKIIWKGIERLRNF
jgi:hypothetical protein